MQLAVWDTVFLLDMVNLPKCVPEGTLRQFIADIFGSSLTLKLGQSIFPSLGANLMRPTVMLYRTYRVCN